MDSATNGACGRCAGELASNQATDGIDRRTFLAQSALLAAVRTTNTSFVALSRVCPHQGNIVNQDGNAFLCPGHGARFSANGTWIGGERTSSLRSYPTTYDAAAGTITVG